MDDLLGELELVMDAKAMLGEGPCWDNEKQILYWVDVLGKKIYIYNPITKANRIITLKQCISAIVPRNENEVVVALEDGFSFLNLITEKITPINDPEKHIINNRFNDGKCDAYGRFWAGTMNKSYVEGCGALYCLDTDFKVKRKLNNIGISNGIAWSLDNRFMYYIDTFTKSVCRFNYNIETGDIINRMEVINFQEEEGLPDGMTIDAEGMLWIAHWGGSKISRWNPNTNMKIAQFEIPAINVTSCTFGGEDLNELYITTAKEGLKSEQLTENPFSGGLFRLKTTVKGISSHSFKG